MGRKPGANRVYFGKPQEECVRVFLTAATFETRHRVYKDCLHAPLTKMIDSIIRRYKLYRKDWEFRDIHADTLSFLITKAEKFKPEKGKKAYSYFGTICKNYLMAQLIKDQKLLTRNISYEDISHSVQQRPEMLYTMAEEKVEPNVIVNQLVGKIEDFMAETKLNENEQKIGNALIEVFTNYERVFEGGTGNKFNKNLILLNLREMTNMNTKEIRASLKKYKLVYEELISKFRE
tara:strand:+ start:2060 stop:2761 length:702 start_codon:yes stop_codon:yes gene_type:complete